MRRQLSLFTLIAISAITLSAQPISVGSVAPDFSLKNIDGSTISLSDYSNEKGVMVIFSCNPCPYVIAYEDRIIDLENASENVQEAFHVLRSFTPRGIGARNLRECWLIQAYAIPDFPKLSLTPGMIDMLFLNLNPISNPRFLRYSFC